MTQFGVLQEGRTGRSARQAELRRRRRRRRIRFGLAMISIVVIVLLVVMASGVTGPSGPSATRRAVRARAQQHHGANPYGVVAASVRVRPGFHTAVSSGLLFDVRTGRILWERNPSQPLPIASLTKMMTALVIAAHASPRDKVLITRQAVDFSGSGVGDLPYGKRVELGPLLYGLLLPSGNDAAIALAQHVARTQAHFIALMNATARAMGLGCTHFNTVSGIVDYGNFSCATDLARIAHAILSQSTLARVVGSASAVFPFPIKGGKLFLYNNNPLLRMAYPGADGVKTGYTQAAGRCLVATAKRGHRWLGVVLLHSDDPPGQAVQLLNLGFHARNV